MKFGAVLRDSAADLPDTEDLFLKYKQLKKSLKRMQSTQQAAQNPSAISEDSDLDEDTEAWPSTKRGKYEDQEEETETEKENGAIFLLDPELETEFLRVVTADVMELNDRYIEKEEDNVIKFGQLEDAAKAASTSELRSNLYKAFVDLHGELLMLFHWSVLAYTGLVKILKKHQKRTGAPLHAPHLENLLSQPFCSVEVTVDMVRKAEEWVSKLAKDLHVPPLPAVPLPDGLLSRMEAHGSGNSIASPPDGVDGGNHAINGDTLDINGASGTLPTAPDEAEKAKVLEAVAAAVAVAEAAETETAVADGTDTTTGNEAGKSGKGGKDDESNKSGTAVATSVVEENVAVRKIRAALNVWQQLQTNVSTPSTMIAPGADAEPVGANEPPASLTTSSIA